MGKPTALKAVGNRMSPSLLRNKDRGIRNDKAMQSPQHESFRHMSLYVSSMCFKRRMQITNGPTTSISYLHEENDAKNLQPTSTIPYLEPPGRRLPTCCTSCSHLYIRPMAISGIGYATGFLVPFNCPSF